MYRPGLAWDAERLLLYVVHPDVDAVTLVDLERGTIVETTNYAPRRSFIDRVHDWLAPTAAAGPVPHTIRQALLSADGHSLYVAPGGHWSQNNWWEEDADRTGLQVIDTANLSRSVEVDLPRVNTMLLSPDGRLLILHTFEQSHAGDGRPMRINDRIVALSTDDLRARAAFDAGGVDYSHGSDATERYIVHGISPDGTTLYIVRRDYVDGAQSGEIILLDVATMTPTAFRAFDESYDSFVTLMTP